MGTAEGLALQPPSQMRLRPGYETQPIICIIITALAGLAIHVSCANAFLAALLAEGDAAGALRLFAALKEPRSQVG